MTKSPIKKEVVIGDCRLILGDCIEVMPTLGKVDAIITDPPYGLADRWAGGGGGRRSSWRFDPKEAMAWDQEAPAFVPDMIGFANEVVIWGGNYFRLPPSRCWLVWDKKQNDNWTTAQCELAWTNLDRPVRAFRMAQCEQASEGKKFHPTQKPIGLMLWCFKWILGQTILDPFMGSGTTLVACAKLGRKGIGIESDPDYFEIACKRVREAYAQPDMFVEQAKPAKQIQEGFDL